jgi:hypothetical protein
MLLHIVLELHSQRHYKINRLNLGNLCYSLLHKLFSFLAKNMIDKYAKLYSICGFGCGTWS